MLLIIFERTVMFMRDRAKCKLRGGRSGKMTSVERVSSPTISIHGMAGGHFETFVELNTCRQCRRSSTKVDSVGNRSIRCIACGRLCIPTNNMNANVYTACYVGAGAFVLFLAHLIRTRLKAKHPQIYVKLGSPGFNDSNLGPTFLEVCRLHLVRTLYRCS